MADDNKPVKYMRYAVGEVILVVIGILIALQINNLNELNKERNREVHYLRNIKTTLLNMELLYKIMKDEEDHFRYDAEVLLYEPSYGMIDLHIAIKSLTYRLSNVPGHQLPITNYQYAYEFDKYGFYPLNRGTLLRQHSKC